MSTSDTPDADATTPHQPSRDCPEPADLAPLFPQLEVLELRGRGGMGLVYKARQKRLDRLVALKVLPWRADRPPELPERFEREARALARLQHPGIVGVHDSGQVGDWYYLLMEYVEGLDLREAVRQEWMRECWPDGQVKPAVTNGRVSDGVVVAIAREVLEALEYAHGQGIIHRDLKPENVLVSTAGKFKVADFGLAKLLRRGAEERSLTSTGVTMGTWAYMAPEQLARPGEVDHRADLYSLGVVLYELLTAEKPVGHFAPPSARAGSNPRLDGVVAKALAADPASRFQSAAEMKAALLAAWAQPAPAAGQAAPEWVAKMLGDMFGGAAQVNIQNADGTTVVIPAAPAPPKYRHLSWRSLVGWGAGFLAAWSAVALLWNAGLAGLALGAIVLAGSFALVLRESLRHLPEMSEALSKQDGPTRGLRWGVATCLFLAGCGLLLFTPPLARDARLLARTNQTIPFTTDYPGGWRHGEWVLPADMREFFTAALPGAPAEFGGTRTRLVLTPRRDASPGSFHSLLVWVVGLAGGATLLCCSTLAVPGGRVFWSAGAGLAAVVAVPFLVVMGAAPAWGPPATLGWPPTPHVTGVGLDQLADDLRDWARAEGYELFGGGEWDLAFPQGPGKKVGRLSVYQARVASPFRRWWLRPFVQPNRSHDLVILLVDAEGGLAMLQAWPVGLFPEHTELSPHRAFDGGLIRFLGHPRVRR